MGWLPALLGNAVVARMDSFVNERRWLALRFDGTGTRELCFDALTARFGWRAVPTLLPQSANSSRLAVAALDGSASGSVEKVATICLMAVLVELVPPC